MAGVEVVADRDAHQEHEAGDDPVILGRKRQRVVVRQHQEQHRQGKVVVVRAALLGDLAIFRVRLAPGLQVRHHDALVRHDDEKHVGRHNRRGKRAQMQQRRATGKDVSIAPAHRDKDDIKPDHQPRVVVAKLRLADQVIHDPANHKRADRDANRLRHRQRHHRRVDQKEVRAEVIDQDHHGKARHPGHVAFPFEPDQMVRHRLGRHQIFLDVVKPAAMHLPLFAIRARRQIAVAVQAKVKRDEIER
ncbi:hypothetical protein GALL_478530 [mine drainage metagenome]|uniref:Uncharacterized protein n=1 Tax=mine drainage metagenome TaxID=410659 RepID=A0A1J5Q3T4_9ZZZZ